MVRFLLFLLLLLPSAGSVLAEDERDDEELPLYYVVEREALLFDEPEGRPYVELGLREQLRVLEDLGQWMRVRTQDGAEGFVRPEAVSNVWIRVSKRERMVYIYRGPDLFHAFPADLGPNGTHDKVERGGVLNPDHWRTPEGRFHVVGKNAQSTYHKALVINYPAPDDAREGLRRGVITQAEHDAIVAAAQTYEMPPMNTPLGGWIEIHGQGTGARVNWTQGCVAITNDQIDAIWPWVDIGTPVLIE